MQGREERDDAHISDNNVADVAVAHRGGRSTGSVLSGSAVALPSDASGNLDRNENQFPRMAPDACYASSSVNADGQGNFPMAFRLRRNGEVVASDVTTLFRANNGTIAFQRGLSELVAVNQRPEWPARLPMALVCH
jgi:hypothetical protein